MAQRAWWLRARLAWVAPFARTGLADGRGTGGDVGDEIVSGQLVPAAAGDFQIEGELPQAQSRPFLHADVILHKQGEIGGNYEVFGGFAVGYAFEAVLPDIARLIESCVSQLHGPIRFPRYPGQYQLALHAQGVIYDKYRAKTTA